jgi:hypothetical protein
MINLPETESVYKGLFFLSDHKNDKLPGTLTIYPSGLGNLEVLGAFPGQGLLNKREQVTILGILFNGDKVSLIDSYKGKGVYAAGGTFVNYSTGTIIHGTHILSRSVDFFYTISVEIDQLQEWIGIDGGEMSFSFDLKTMNYKYEEPVAIEFDIDETLKGSIYFKNEFWDGLDFKYTSEQKTRFEIESSEDVSADYLIKKAYSFQKLISIFIGQKVRILKCVLQSRHERVKYISDGDELNDDRPLKTIFTYFSDHQRYSELPDRPVFFVRYSDVATIFENTVKNWYKIVEGELAPVTNILLEAIADHRVFEESDFIKTWQGIEAFHRLILQDTDQLKRVHKEKISRIKELIADEILKKWALSALHFGYEPAAKERLRSIIKDHSHLLGASPSDEAIQKWVKEMGDTRNYLTHFDPTGKSKKIAGKKLYQYTCLLKLLLIILIMKQLGVEDDLLKNLHQHQNLQINDLLKI